MYKKGKFTDFYFDLLVGIHVWLGMLIGCNVLIITIFDWRLTFSAVAASLLIAWAVFSFVYKSSEETYNYSINKRDKNGN